MNREQVFTPARRLGIIFHAAFITALACVGLYGFVEAGRAQSSLLFWLFLLLPAAVVGAIPRLIYQVYSLTVSSYILERDGIRLRWGTRAEDIPMNAVLWVRPASEAGVRLLFPFFAWPGAVRGKRRLPDGREIEYLADRTTDVLVIATPQRLYVISPEDTLIFLEVLRQYTELGTLTPIPAHSMQPAFISSQFWNDLPARLLFFGELIFSLALLAGVGVAISGRRQVSLRLDAQGLSLESVPAIRLLLLPALNVFFSLVDALLGLFFYHRAEVRSLAYLVWAASLAVSLLFLGAVIFILRA